ncbi:MAG TPA: hypothetical protein VK890_00620, partial [Bacteroidia bacterium]|nr:hypothetical protein [Bacteroidia bacterium]
MTLFKKYLPLAVVAMLSLVFNKTWAKSEASFMFGFSITLVSDTPPQTSNEPLILPFPFSDQSDNGQPLYAPDGGLMLSNPSNLKTEIQYNP